MTVIEAINIKIIINQHKEGFITLFAEFKHFFERKTIMYCDPECTVIVFSAMKQIPETNPAQPLYAEKISAFMSLLAKCKYYQDEHFAPKLIVGICRKKAEFIKEAKTKKELQMIMVPPDVRYNGNEIIPANQYCVPEEELIVWSFTTLRGPLISEAQKRYEKLFKQFFPDKTDIFN